MPQLPEALRTSKKLIGKALAKFEAKRDMWQEVLDGVWKFKAGGGKRTKAETSRTLFARDPPRNCTLTLMP